MVVVDRSGAEVARLHEEPGHYVESVSFSPDGRLLATTREGERVDPTDMDVTIWDWERGEVVSTIDTSAAWSSSTRPAAGSQPAAGPGNRRRLGRADGRPPGDARGASSRSATSPSVRMARRWPPDSPTARCGCGTRRRESSSWCSMATRAGSARACSARTAPSSHRSATTASLRVWALDLDDLIAIANDRLTRTLSDDECRQYLHVERCPPA